MNLSVWKKKYQCAILDEGSLENTEGFLRGVEKTRLLSQIT